MPHGQINGLLTMMFKYKAPTGINQSARQLRISRQSLQRCDKVGICLGQQKRTIGYDVQPLDGLGGRDDRHAHGHRLQHFQTGAAALGQRDQGHCRTRIERRQIRRVANQCDTGHASGMAAQKPARRSAANVQRGIGEHRADCRLDTVQQSFAGFDIGPIPKMADKQRPRDPGIRR